MPAFKDITGQTFGKLTVISLHHSDQRPYWLCQCDCGNTTIARSDHLKTSRIKSCGCMRRANSVIRFGSSNGLYLHKLYQTWVNIQKRCHDKNGISYKDYGARGIKVCERWRSSFQHFLDDMGERPDNHSIDRIDNDGDYSPTNCKWSTYSEQRLNQRQRKYRTITIDNVIKTISEWAKHKKISNGIIRYRLKTGWSEYDAVMTPIRGSAP